MSFVAVAIGGAGAIGGIVSGVLGSNAAGDAASLQANASNQAAALQYASGQNALAYQNYIFQQQQANQRPWLSSGQNALNLLSKGVGLTPQATQQASQMASQTPQPTILPPPQGVTNSYQQSAQNQLAQYQGQSFDQLVHSGDPNISPNAATTQAWTAQGIPFQLVTTPDGRTVAVKINPLAGLTGTGGSQSPIGGTSQPGGGGGTQPQARIQQMARPIDNLDIGDGGGNSGGGQPPINPWTGQPISGIPANPYYPQNLTPQNPSGLPNYSGQPASPGGINDATGGNMGQPVFKGGQWIPPASSGGQPQQQASGGGTNGVPGAPNAFAQPTDFSGAGALTNPYPYQFNAPQPFQGQQFQGSPSFQPPNAFAAPAPFSAPTFQGMPGFQAPAPYSGQTFQGTPGFQAPTGATEQNDPGYKFRLQQGLDALQSSAAAKGDLFTGGTGKAIEQYGQDYASNEYQNVFNRSLATQQNAFNQAYGTSQLGFGQGLAQNQNAFNQGLTAQQSNYGQAANTSQLGFGQGLSQQQNAFTQGLAGQQNQYQQGLATQQNQFQQALAGNQQQFNQGLTGYQTNYQNALTNYQQAYNQFQQGQGNAFNRLAAISGIGQTAAGQLNSVGQTAGNGIASTLTGTAGAIGQQLNNAAAAQGAGAINSANQIGGALGVGVNSITDLLAQLHAAGKI